MKSEARVNGTRVVYQSRSVRLENFEWEELFTLTKESDHGERLSFLHRAPQWRLVVRTKIIDYLELV